MMAALQDTVTIGEISYRKNDFIANGSHNTVVYRGLFRRRKVAVKTIPLRFAVIAEKEKDLLLRIDVNPNIVRYYHMEKDNDGYYIALMLCHYTLMEYVTPKYDNLNLTPIEVLKEVTLGLQFLHESKIIHHDLKPLNILISYPNHWNERKAMISDFGISKETIGTRDSVTLTTRRGTDGFVAPEVFANDTVTNAIDVFALGCIYSYVLSNGKQIFYSANDVEDEKMFQTCIDRFLEKENPNDYFSLVLRMIDRDATRRPTCEQILFHRMYWTAQDKMQFLQGVSDFIDCDEIRRSKIDHISSEITGDNWHDQMSDNVITDLAYGKFNQGRKKAPKELPNEDVRILIQKYYDGTKTSSLLRAIRNICNHYDDIIIRAKDEITSEECFMDYCCSKFPKLLSKVYDMAEKWTSCKSIGKFYITKDCKVGQITFQMQSKIKIARNGNILYKGQYNKCKVAIKMFTADWSSLGKNQWDLLQNMKLPNVVQLLHKEEKDNCLYIVTTLGQYNLFEYVDNYWNNDNPTPLQLLKQITNGLAFLHAWNIG